jgi:hypothetical protein
MLTNLFIAIIFERLGNVKEEMEADREAEEAVEEHNQRDGTAALAGPTEMFRAGRDGGSVSCLP